jgi:hypothetical protein
MILDKQLYLADDLAYTVWGGAGTYYSTNCIDLTKTKTQMEGAKKKLQVKMNTAAATGTILAFSLVTSTAPWTDTAGTGVANEVVLATSGAIATASLTANKVVWEIDLPDTISGRYLGLKIVSVETSDFTTGDFDAYIVAGDTPLATY